MVLERSINSPKQTTHKEAVARAQALAPVVAEHASTAETLRRLPENIVQAIVDAGLVRLLTPARWGGHELSFDTVVETIIEFAKADASVGWCYSFFNMHSWMLARFPEQAQRDVWAHNPDALITTSFAPVGQVTSANGGYILTATGPGPAGWTTATGASSPGCSPPRKRLRRDL